MPRVLRIFTPALLALVSACKDEAAPADVEEVTFWQHAAPIFYDKCVGCHSEGGIAPFRLDNYEDARTWSRSSAQAVAARTMPPFLMTADGSCGEFLGSPALTQAEIDTLVAWADADAPEGQPRTDLVAAAPPTLDSGLDLHTPDFVPVAQGGPLASFDEYRCFLLEPGLDRDVFLTGYDVQPGNPRLVHHVLAMPVDLDAESWRGDGSTNGQVIAELDAMEPDRDGWPCFSAAGEGVSVRQLPVTWAPGMGVVEYPEGTGARLSETDVVVIQVHYNLFDGPDSAESDSTLVRLRTADAVEREGYFVLLDSFLDTLFADQPATIEPGAERARYAWEMELGPMLQFDFGIEQAEVHGIFPHMHEYGRKWRAALLDDEGERCVGDVRRWDFNWQLYYFFEQPPTITTRSRLKVECEYDTRGASDPVLPGWGTQNEMCLAGLFVVPPK
jgi:hypothetical protein